MEKEGRPLVFETPEEMQTKVNEYFEWVKGEKTIFVNEEGDREEKWTRFPRFTTITGLALYLGFESRQSIYDYEKRGQFSYIIKNARLRVEDEYEQRLHTSQPTGAIFALKNMGWRDKVETGFTDGEGNDVPPVIILPHNNRDNNNSTKEAE